MNKGKVVIIGNGIAGSTAARNIRKLSDYEIIMISDESRYPFSRTALMYIFMGHVRREDTSLYEDWFWEKNRIQLMQGFVTHVDTNKKNIVLETGEVIDYDKLIIAAGSKPAMFTWPGQELRGVQGLYHLRDLETIETMARGGINRAVIVGGGLIGIEMAEMLHSRHIPVTMLVREDGYWNAVLPPEESAMVTMHIQAHGIDLRLNEELLEINGEDGRVTSVVCKHTGDEIPCGFVGLTIGVSPNVAFLASSDIRIDKGVLADDFLQTSAEDVFAIGDCAQIADPKPGRKPIEAVWYTGRLMGEAVAKTICGQPTAYNPGIWFNAAKFFEIEYQVFGDIPNRTPENIGSLFWQHPKENKSIRINYELKSGSVTGFTLLGIRYRHAVCEKWLADKTNIKTVLENLSLANFDPEFFDVYHDKLTELYNSRTRIP